MQKQKKRLMDLTTGSVTKKLITFTIPIILSNLLQYLYNAADRAVVGRFAENGKEGLAAIGATGSAITLLLGLFIGLAIGTNIVCSNLKGARNTKALRKSMHTAMLLSVIVGVTLTVVGLFVSKPMLLLMGAPEDVIDLATLYMRIYFCGVPATMIYNFGSAILRAHGDTQRPMRILALSGLINVALNLVLVIAFHMSVAGVAIATAVAQAVSAFRVCYILFNPKDEYKLSFVELKIDKQQLWNFIRIGVPCSLNSMAFSFANTIMQSTVNTWGSDVIAGNVAADSVTSIIYQVIAGFYSGCVSFAGQNYGAHQYKRISRGIISAILILTGATMLMGALCLLFSNTFMGVFNNDPEVLAAGKPKLHIFALFYWLYGISEVLIGVLRGMKKSMVPTVINLLGVCGTRLVWIWWIYPLAPSTGMIYVVNPISWILSLSALLVYYFYCRTKLIKRLRAEHKSYT